MRTAPVVACVLVAGCATDTRTVVHTVHDPALPPTVIIETVPVVPRVVPPAVSSAVVQDYEQNEPAVARAVIASHKPDTIYRLTTLDRAVRAALRPLVARHHHATAAEVSEAIKRLTELDVATAEVSK